MRKEVELALNEAARKLAQGKLIKASDDFDWDDVNNYTDGDPESVYSIISLYSDCEDSQIVENEITAALYEKYSDFF